GCSSVGQSAGLQNRMSQVRLLSPLPAARPTRPPYDETRKPVSDSTDTALGSPSRGSGDGDGTAATRTRRGDDRPGRIRNIGTFYRQVVAELRKVIWPTRGELTTYTTVVVFFVLVMVLIVAIFDFAFGKAVLAVFGE